MSLGSTLHSTELPPLSLFHSGKLIVVANIIKTIQVDVDHHHSLYEISHEGHCKQVFAMSVFVDEFPK